MGASTCATRRHTLARGRTGALGEGNLPQHVAVLEQLVPREDLVVDDVVDDVLMNMELIKNALHILGVVL